MYVTPKNVLNPPLPPSGRTYVLYIQCISPTEEYPLTSLGFLPFWSPCRWCPNVTYVYDGHGWANVWSYKLCEIISRHPENESSTSWSGSKYAWISWASLRNLKNTGRLVTNGSFRPHSGLSLSFNQISSHLLSCIRTVWQMRIGFRIMCGVGTIPTAPEEVPSRSHLMHPFRYLRQSPQNKLIATAWIGFALLIVAGTGVSAQIQEASRSWTFVGGEISTPDAKPRSHVRFQLDKQQKMSTNDDRASGHAGTINTDSVLKEASEVSTAVETLQLTMEVELTPNIRQASNSKLCPPYSLFDIDNRERHCYNKRPWGRQ